MQDNKRRKIAYSSLLVVFVFLILLGIGGMLLNLNGLYIHKNGWDVEGTIVSYEVRRVSSGSKSDKCFFKCEYVDATSGRHYYTTTSYPVANKTDSKDWCESKIGEPIELVIDEYGHCMAKRDMTFELVRWIFLPRGIFIIVGTVGIVVVLVKKFYFDKRKKAPPKPDDEACEPLDRLGE